MNIADRIQNLRKVKGISQEELADRIGVSRQAVSKWESEQSIPEIDKIVLMSEFFEVTTDYILKGIEVEKQAPARTQNASIFSTVATALNFIGLVLAGVVWYQEQVPMATVIGAIFMALGCMVFGIGLACSTENIKRAKYTFWTVNIWILVFIPLSLIYNILLSRFPAPYPMFWGTKYNLIVYPVFWIVYIAVCLCVVLTQVKAQRKS